MRNEPRQPLETKRDDRDGRDPPMLQFIFVSFSISGRLNYPREVPV